MKTLRMTFRLGFPFLHLLNSELRAAPRPDRYQRHPLVIATQSPAYRCNPLANKAKKNVAVESNKPISESVPSR